MVFIAVGEVLVSKEVVIITAGVLNSCVLDLDSDVIGEFNGRLK